jgi:outer membrane lipoprotein-sorting protein
MKKIIILCLLATSIFSANAQQDPKATELLDKVSEKTQSYNTITADFTYIFENLQEQITDSMQGTIHLKGEKYKLLFPGYERYYDGDKIVTVLLDADEANITSPESTEEEIDPSKIFSIYKSGFKYAHKGPEYINGKKYEVVDLFPKEVDNKNYSRIRILIDPVNYHIYTIKRFDKDGNRFTIRIDQMKTNTSLQKNFFVFEPAEHPEIDVIDMR